MTVQEIFNRFPTEDSCLSYLESIRWPSGIRCVRCDSDRISKRRAAGKRHHCNKCNHNFSVLNNSVMSHSKLPVRIWVVSINLITQAKKGISSLQLSRHLGIDKDTAWYLQMRLRLAMQQDIHLDGVVELDETFIGGELVNKSRRNRANKYGHIGTGYQHMSPVLGMIQRGGQVVLKSIEKAKGDIIKPIIRQLIAPHSILITDGFGGYYGLSKEFDKHIVLEKTKHQFTQGSYHLNNIEQVWSMLSRAIKGQYHRVSPRYLQRYIDEVAFKINYPETSGFNKLLFAVIARI